MIFKKKIAKLLEEATKKKDLIDLIEIPPKPELGDYAFPCFSLGKNPALVAKELAEKIDYSNFIEVIKPFGPYVNFFIKKSSMAKEVLNGVDLSIKEKKSRKNVVLVEYSQPNPLKAFHVGHIRGTTYGESLARIIRNEGSTVKQVNYMGDTGAHIAKWLWAYKKFHDGEKPPKNGREKWLAQIYVEAYNKSLDNKQAEKEISEIYQSLENHSDKNLEKLWKTAKQWSIDEFNIIYDELDAHFDHDYFESQMEERGKAIAHELLNKKIAEKSDGAIILNCEKEKLGVWVLLRKDGTTLYSVKDLALAERKLHDYKFDVSITMTGAAQNLHFKQIQYALKLMKYPKVYDHLGFAEVRLPQGKMSSRTGVNVLYSDLKKEMITTAIEEVNSRHPEWKKDKIESVANDLFVGAIKYVMISQDLNKPITFDPQKSLRFDGDTGPYLQYTHARACSILQNAKIAEKIDYNLLSTKEEHELIKKLGMFSSVVVKAADTYKVNLIANYASELCQLFNTFYHEHKVIQQDKHVQDARLKLVHSFRLVISKCLMLLGIPSPETI